MNSAAIIGSLMGILALTGVLSHSAQASAIGGEPRYQADAQLLLENNDEFRGNWQEYREHCEALNLPVVEQAKIVEREQLGAPAGTIESFTRLVQDIGNPNNPNRLECYLGVRSTSKLFGLRVLVMPKHTGRGSSEACETDLQQLDAQPNRITTMTSRWANLLKIYCEAISIQAGKR